MQGGQKRSVAHRSAQSGDDPWPLSALPGLLRVLAAPCAWALLIAFGYYADEQTEWGRSGHPSLGVLIVIFTLIGAPFFAAVGIYLAAHYRRTMPSVIYGAGIFVNFTLALFGMGFWMYLWLRG